MGKKGYEDIYNEYVLEDEEYIEEIGELASRCIRRDFGISFSDEKDVIMCYNEMKKKIASLRRTNNSFEINFANRFVFGFDNTNADTDDEKDGNFTPYFFNIENNSATFQYAGRRIEALNITWHCPFSVFYLINP